MEQEAISLSIVIPHFESIESLKRLLISIGDHRDVQTIVVDDCSSIDVGAQLKGCFPKVECYRSERHGGAGCCRNIGLKNAVGTWLLFADADDYLMEDWYTKVEKYFTSDYDIVFFAPTSVYDDTDEIADRHIPYEEFIADYCNNLTKSAENCLRYKYTAPWSKMIRNDMVQINYIGFEEVSVSNDVLFSTRCGYQARHIVADKQVIYCITRGRGTLTTKRNFENVYIRASEYIKSYLFLKERISRVELKELHFSGAYYLLIALQNSYSIKQWHVLLKLMITNHLPIWDYSLIRKSFNALQSERVIRKYMESEKEVHK